MANQLGIVHPEMLSRLQLYHYASACTIQQASEIQDSHGQLIPTWANVAGLVNLRCRIAPNEAFSRELQSSEMKYAIHEHQVAMAGHHPTIIETMRAVIDGSTYEIRLVEHDGNDKTTRLRVKVVA